MPRIVGLTRALPIVFLNLATVTAYSADPPAKPNAEKKNLPAANSTTAEQPNDELLKLVRDAQSGFKAVTPAELEAARADLQSALRSLDAYLKWNGANGAAWKRYLQWDALVAASQPNAAPNSAALESAVDRFSAGHAGLELPWFTNARRALRVFANRAEALANPNAKADFDKQLADIAAGLQAAGKKANAPVPELQRLSDVAARLHRSGRAPQLVAALRERFATPNLLVQVSSDFLTSGMSRNVDETEPVQDVINGTRISGTGRTIGRAQTQLINDPTQGVILTHFEATNHSRTIGRNGPALIYTSAATELNGWKYITLDSEGFHGLPAKASATSNSNVTGVGSTKHGIVDKIVKKVAWKKIPQEKPKSDREASLHAGERLQQRLDSEAGKLLARSNENFAAKLRNPLLRYDEFPSLFRFATRPDELNLTVLKAEHGRLGAMSPPPQANGRPDIIVRMHESLVNNTTSGMLAGKTLTQDRIEEIALNLGATPDRFQNEEGKEPWSITFADVDPITLHIAGNRATLSIRGKRYTSGPKAYDAMNVTAHYQLSSDGKAIKAVRQGELEIFPPGFVPGGGQQLALRQTVLRNLLQKRFGKIFEAEFVSKPIEMKENWKQAGTLYATQLQADNGWLLVGMDAEKSGPTPLPPVAAAATSNDQLVSAARN
jgi:hypothetical protein